MEVGFKQDLTLPEILLPYSAPDCVQPDNNSTLDAEAWKTCWAGDHHGKEELCGGGAYINEEFMRGYSLLPPLCRYLLRR